MSFPRPHLNKHTNGHYRRDWLVISFLSLVEDLTALLSLGWISWDLRAWALFDLYGGNDD